MVNVGRKTYNIIYLTLYTRRIIRPKLNGLFTRDVFTTLCKSDGFCFTVVCSILLYACVHACRVCSATVIAFARRQYNTCFISLQETHTGIREINNNEITRNKNIIVYILLIYQRCGQYT